MDGGRSVHKSPTVSGVQSTYNTESTSLNTLFYYRMLLNPYFALMNRFNR
jgi:hypothetical protein